MQKIPVGATIAQAWRFVGGNFFSILGIMAPLLILSWVPGFLMHGPGAAKSLDAAMGEPARMATLWPMLAPIYLASLVLLPMQLIGIAELALGTKKAPRWFYFSLGWPVWRLLGSILFLLLAVIVGAIAALLGGVVLGLIVKLVLGAVTAGWAIALKGAILLVGGIAIWCGCVYSLVRLTFLLIPVVAANEPGFAVVRGWALGAGNFWRMFVLILTVLVPLIVLEMILIFGLMFKGVSFPPPHASAAQTAAFQAAMNANVLQAINSVYAYWYVALPVFVALMVVVYGFTIATQVFAFQALASDPVTANRLPD